MDQTELRVLHALRLKGFADTGEIAAAAEVDPLIAQGILDGLAASDQARYRDGHATGWTLLPAGRKRGEGLLAAQVDAAGKRDDLSEVYQRFLELNQPFLRLCTEWQTREVDGERIMNDRSDAAYDAGVIERLRETDIRIQPVCADLGALFSRFANYGPRFAKALDQVQAGHIDWFTKPFIDSYHTVWFELHDDLLASLGIERAKEQSA